MRGFGLPGPTERRGGGQFDPFAQEFLEGARLAAVCEKIRQGVAQRGGRDELGGGDPWADGAQPGAEGRPDQGGLLDREGLQEPLGDHADLDVAMVGGELAVHGLAIAIGCALHVLRARAAREILGISRSQKW